MEYGIIFCDNLSDSKKVLTLQKEIVRIVMDVKSRNPCRDLFNRLEILTLAYGYLFSVIKCVTNNELFQTNADLHSVNTRHKHYLHKPTANLSCFQKGAYYDRIQIFNNLLSDLKSLKSERARFKMALKQYLNLDSVYSVDEYLLFKK
jgi:hypothetical protein